MTVKQLLEAMDADFEGYEYERALLKAAPKYGNDDDYADAIFDDLSVWLQNRMFHEKNPFGTPLWAGRSGAMAHVTFGRKTGPLPSGHKSGEPIARWFLFSVTRMRYPWPDFVYSIPLLKQYM